MATTKGRGRGPRRSGASLPSDPIRNLIVRAIKIVWTKYDENRRAVIQAARVERIRFRKDGTPSARPDVSHRCAICGELVKDYQVDHIKPVGEFPPWPPRNDSSWDRFLFDQFCIGNENNLQVLCKGCHQVKTDRELGHV